MNYTTRVRTRQAGFTLIELIAVIGAISIFTGVFLPAVQRAREQANRDASEKALRQIAAALETHYQQKGSFPASLPEVQATALNFSYYAAGRAGYRLVPQQMQPKRVRLLSEPVAGVTGSFTGVLEVTGNQIGAFSQLNFVPTPGADEGRRKLLADVREECARAIGRLAGIELPAVQKTALEQFQSSMQAPITQRQSFDAMKGVDGNVSLLSARQWTARTGGTASGGVMDSLWSGIARAMQLGAYGEDWDSLPGLNEKALNFSTPAPDHLLNFKYVSELTSRWVSDVEGRGALMQILSEAAAADRNHDLQGKQRAVTNFVSILQGHQNRFFSWGLNTPIAGYLETETLILLARAL
jgi:prepilin-type N-terminal cleavage/methylation domain-containing protein